MTVVLNRRADITLETVRRAAWESESVEIGEEAAARMQAARDSFFALLDANPDMFVYGVTNLSGERVSTRISREESRERARKVSRGSAVSFGGALPERVVRAIVVARLANFLEGHAAVRPELAREVAAMLDRPLPRVPARGNGGAGEILPLGHLFGGIAETFGLEIKERGGLVNGSPGAAGLVADAVLSGRNRLALAEEVLALSIEAFKAPMYSYKPELDEIWEDEHEAAALRRIRELLEGGAAERRPYQAPVSYRIVPRVLGQARRALAQAEEVAASSLRSVSDNPVYIPPDDAHPHGQVFSTGGYHNGKAYPAIDQLAATWADLAQIAERHAVGIVYEVPAWEPNERPGYLTTVGFTLVGFSEEARTAASRTFLPGSSGGLAQDDVTAPAFFAWEKNERAGLACEANLAYCAAMAGEALRTSGRQAPPALHDLLTLVHEHVPPYDEARSLGLDVERLAEAFAARVYALE
jgi:histidine ammonia-lyase